MELFKKILGKKEEDSSILATERNTVYAPVSGKLIDLKDFPDEVFSEGILGQGCGILPSEEIIKAPFNGEVIQLQDSLHALGLMSEDGIELLIHVGVDTVTMDGKGFRALVKTGDKVKMGQNLLQFNLARISEAGLDSTVAIIVTNSDDFKEINAVSPNVISATSPIITLT